MLGFAMVPWIPAALYVAFLQVYVAFIQVKLDVSVSTALSILLTSYGILSLSWFAALSIRRRTQQLRVGGFVGRASIAAALIAYCLMIPAIGLFLPDKLLWSLVAACLAAVSSVMFWLVSGLGNRVAT